jgi:hypothetical protein
MVRPNVDAMHIGDQDGFCKFRPLESLLSAVFRRESKVMEHDAARRGDIEGIEVRRHRDAHGPASGENGFGQAMPLGSKQQGDAIRTAEVGERRRALWAEGDRLISMGCQEIERVILASQTRERQDQRRAHGDPDRLAVEWIAAIAVEDDRIGPEGRGIPENPAHIVVVGDPEKDDDQGARPGASELLFRGGWRAATAEGKNAAMHREADNPRHYFLTGNVDGDRIRQGRDQRLERCDALFRDQQRHGLMETPTEEDADDHLTFGDE